MKLSWTVFGALVVAALTATVTTLPAANAADTLSVPANPTFTKDVLPIFQKSCQDCHRPGQMAPFSLITYDDARPWARSIKDKVVSRYMPPWHLDRTIGDGLDGNNPHRARGQTGLTSSVCHTGPPMNIGACDRTKAGASPSSIQTWESGGCFPTSGATRPAIPPMSTFST